MKEMLKRPRDGTELLCSLDDVNDPKALGLPFLMCIRQTKYRVVDTWLPYVQ